MVTLMMQHWVHCPMSELRSSAGLFSERNYNNGSNIFNSTELGDSRAFLFSEKNGTSGLNTTLDHIPGMIQLREYENGKSIKIPLENIIANIENNLLQYGYSVVVFHPQDLVRLNENGSLPDTTTAIALDIAEIDRLSEVIDAIMSKNIRIATLSDLAGIETRAYSYFK
jgi:hypothetical protein